MQRNAVVTGCSVGLGRATALRLARGGWRVFASLRSGADADTLLKEDVGSGRIEPVQLDVRDRTAIEAARAYVALRIEDEGLHALVNNAGLAVVQPIEFASEENLSHQLGVNVLGPIWLIQAFLPALRSARGRIVNVTSGVTKVTQSFTGLYAASKAALDQISMSLRLELAPSGVAVILVDPGLMRTRMTEPGDQTNDAGMADWSVEALERYGDANRANAARISASVPRAKPPEAVAELVVQAVESENPRDQYLAGSDARAADLLNRLLPWRVKQALLDRMVFRG